LGLTTSSPAWKNKINEINKNYPLALSRTWSFFNSSLSNC
jgi:hypothetical protein